LWKSYKIAGRTGEPRSDLAWKINRVAMGLKSEFPELEGMDHDDFEEDQDQGQSAEEIQLRHEEREADDDWWISDG